MLNYQRLQELGRKVGIQKIGVAQAVQLESANLNDWLGRSFQGKMSYMERNLEKRLDPSKLLVGAQSVISVFVNYHQADANPGVDGVISKYAQGSDYHPVIKDILHDLASELFADQVKDLSRKQRALIYRIFVDSAPVMEKQWAVAAGIGWQGKHSNIITREYGSWGFLGEIITTELFDQYDLAVPDYCGTCTACIDACPTSAIVAPYQVDGSKCISYGTIELESTEVIPDEIRSGMGDWLFGCDVCQDVCPWNRFAKPSHVDAFIPIEKLKSGVVPDFIKMEDEEFLTSFSRTPLARPGLKGMRRNQDQ